MKPLRTLLLAAALAASAVAQTPDWRYVSPGILKGISGIVQLDGPTFLVVHDNKKEGEPRAALLTLAAHTAPKYEAIVWPAPLPIDLEALTRVPGKLNTYLACTSRGQVSQISYEPATKEIKVAQTFDLPELPEGVNIEGMSAQAIGGGELVLMWGHRGEAPKPATLFWCTLGHDMKPAGPVGKANLLAPWPTADGARGVSDMKLDPSGAVFVASAQDNGDDGPFASGLYVAGTLVRQGDTYKFLESAPTRLFWTDSKKIEGFDMIPGPKGGLILGTDDENFGSSVWLNFAP